MEVRNRVLGTGSENVLSKQIERNRFRWLGHVLRIVNIRSPCHVLIFDPPMEWKKRGRRQQMTWQQGMIKCTTNLGKIVVSHLRCPAFDNQLAGDTEG